MMSRSTAPGVVARGSLHEQARSLVDEAFAGLERDRRRGVIDHAPLLPAAAPRVAAGGDGPAGSGT